MSAPSTRSATFERRTRETETSVALCLDGRSTTAIATGIAFLDHLLTALAFHAGFDLDLTCRGDLRVDDHHTAEDCALALGAAFDRALGDRLGIARFGWAYAPSSTRPWRAAWSTFGPALGRRRPRSPARAPGGTVDREHPPRVALLRHRWATHPPRRRVARRQRPPHRAEAAFKATALALRQAVALASEGDDRRVPSTKGTLGEAR